MTSPLNLPALRALWEAATAGEWIYCGCGKCGLISSIDCDALIGSTGVIDDDMAHCSDATPQNAAFIAAAHNAFPGLLTAAEERERYREALERIRATTRSCAWRGRTCVERGDVELCTHCLATAALENR